MISTFLPGLHSLKPNYLCSLPKALVLSLKEGCGEGGGGEVGKVHYITGCVSPEHNPISLVYAETPISPPLHLHPYPIIATLVTQASMLPLRLPA